MKIGAGVTSLVLIAASGCDPTCLETVTVTVNDADGQPVDGARITWEHDCCVPDGCVRITNPSGRAMYREETIGPNGSCEIRVEKAGFATLTQRYEFACKDSKKVAHTVTMTMHR